MALITKQRVVVVLLIASASLNLGLLGYLANSGGLRRIMLRFDLIDLPREPAPFQISDEQRFRLLPNPSDETIFAGDSLVADGPWAEFYSNVHNRGIGGERTADVLARLDEILESRPKTIVFLMGSNDLSMAVPVAQLLRNYRTILARVQSDSPKTRVVVLGVLPVNPNYPKAPIYSNKDVRAVNEGLQEVVKAFPTTRYADLSGELSDSNGLLRQEFSVDGLHMNFKGYLAIQPKIRSLLDQP